MKNNDILRDFRMKKALNFRNGGIFNENVSIFDENVDIFRQSKVE